jgi:hypothetical protein
MGIAVISAHLADLMNGNPGCGKKISGVIRTALDNILHGGYSEGILV